MISTVSQYLLLKYSCCMFTFTSFTVKKTLMKQADRRNKHHGLMITALVSSVCPYQIRRGKNVFSKTGNFVLPYWVPWPPYHFILKLQYKLLSSYESTLPSLKMLQTTYIMCHINSQKGLHWTDWYFRGKQRHKKSGNLFWTHRKSGMDNPRISAKQIWKSVAHVLLPRIPFQVLQGPYTSTSISRCGRSTPGNTLPEKQIAGNVVLGTRCNNLESAADIPCFGCLRKDIAGILERRCGLSTRCEERWVADCRKIVFRLHKLTCEPPKLASWVVKNGLWVIRVGAQ